MRIFHGSSVFSDGLVFTGFILGKIGTGIIWIISGGAFGVGALIDLFTLGSQVDQYNTNEELKTLRKTANEIARITASRL